LSAQQNRIDYSQFIAENFGANANYVETLLQRFQSDPALVDESWRAYFTEMLGESSAASQTPGNGGTQQAATASAPPRTTDGNGATANATAHASSPAPAPPVASAPAPVAPVKPMAAAPRPLPARLQFAAQP
jgi:2-oxoglutarate dehydrogenase E1 component